MKDKHVWLMRCPHCGHEADMYDMITCADYWIEIECPHCHRLDDISEAGP